jgi:integrase
MKRIEKEMKGMAPATIWGALEITRRIINFGFRTGMCPRLDFVIKMPQRNNEVVEYLQPEEVARLMDVLDNWPNKPAVRIIRTAMLTGMRRGEIFKLEKRDLDFIQKAITLRNPKGGKTVSIPMNQAVRGLFQEQLADNNKHFPDSPYVFPGIDGRQRKQCSAAKRIKEAAGLPKSFRMFHGLRHHFAVTLANSGKVSLDMIGELLTHKSIDMTRRYAQFLPDTKREASDTATELFEIQRTTGEKFLDSGQKENPSVG